MNFNQGCEPKCAEFIQMKKQLNELDYRLSLEKGYKASLVNENVYLKKKVENMATDNSRLSFEKNELQKDNRVKTEAVNILRDNINKLLEDKKDLKAENEELQKDNRVKTEAVKMYRDNINPGLRKENEGLRAKNEDLQSRLTSAIEEAGELLEENTELLDKAGEFLEENRELLIERDDLKKTLREVRNNYMADVLVRLESDIKRQKLEEIVQDQAQEIENLESLVEGDDPDDEEEDEAPGESPNDCDCIMCQILESALRK